MKTSLKILHNLSLYYLNFVVFFIMLRFPFSVTNPTKSISSKTSHMLSPIVFLNPYHTKWAKFHIFLFNVVQELLISFINAFVFVPYVSSNASEFMIFVALYIWIYPIESHMLPSIWKGTPHLIWVAINDLLNLELIVFIYDILIFDNVEDVGFRVSLSAPKLCSSDIGHLSVSDISYKHVFKPFSSKHMSSRESQGMLGIHLMILNVSYDLLWMGCFQT
jgi:hypothetical protein